MDDSKIRKLERAASQGDVAASAALKAISARNVYICGDCEMFHKENHKCLTCDDSGLVPPPSNGFKICDFCGGTREDICNFNLWQICDAQDKPIPDKFAVICKSEVCQKAMQDDPRLFIEVTWGRGGPGKFMLLCGDCM